MKKRLLTVAFLMGIWGAYAQVGIGTTTPNKSSQLEIVAKDRGILIPQVALKGVTDTATIKNGNVTSLLVWNTSSLEDVSPGYYYWNQGKWMRIIDEDTLLALSKNTTNTSLTVKGDALVLTDSDGNTVSIPLTAINLPTTLVNNGDGSYTYTSENGTTTTIDVPADVINNFNDIVNNGDVLQELITVLGDTYVGGNVYYDGEQFTYVDQDGDSHVINLKQIVQANETITTLVNNGDGTYTYTNESGNEVVIDVPADVVSNFENIINEGDVQTVLNDYIINRVGGNVSYDGTDFYYVNDLDVLTKIDLKKFVQDNETLTVLKDNGDGTFTYTDEDGDDIIFDANTTTFLDNLDGSYTFTNDNGETMTIDTNVDAADVTYDNTLSGLSSTNVKDALDELAGTISGNQGDLMLGDGLEFTGGRNGLAKLLADASIQIANGGIATIKLEDKAVTAEKLDGGVGTAGRIGVADATGTVTYQSLKTVVQANQKTVSVEQGTNITVTPVINDNHTAYTLDVATASGSSLGVVKEAASAPTVAINSAGELSVNLTNLNAIKEVSADYTVAITDAILLGNANAGDLIITLPTAAAENKGKKLTIKKQDSNEDYYITVSGAIDGGLTELYTALPYSGWDLVSDGTQWKITNKF